MNRIEFMTELASLLQDVPAEERREAMEYYNNYFDDAGAENEAQVIKELESPKKVAAILKAGISGYEGEAGEFTDTGYHEPEFEKQDMPERRYTYGQSEEQADNTKDSGKGKMSKAKKNILIIILAICAAPVVLPVAFGLIVTVAACLVTIVAGLLSLVLIAAAVFAAGLVLLGVGAVNLIGELGIGMALLGIGLITVSLGAIATVAMVKLCILAFSVSAKGIRWLLKKPFKRKAVA